MNEIEQAIWAALYAVRDDGADVSEETNKLMKIIQDWYE